MVPSGAFGYFPLPLLTTVEKTAILATAILIQGYQFKVRLIFIA